MPHVKPIITSVVLLCAAAASAQPASEAAYARIVHQRCPGADIVNVQRAAYDLLEVDYFCEG